MERQRDPWEPFRLWLALTIGLYALRASFAATWLGAIPGWVLLTLVLLALALASKALLFPGRVVPYREGTGAGGQTCAKTGSSGGSAAAAHDQPSPRTTTRSAGAAERSGQQQRAARLPPPPEHRP